MAIFLLFALAQDPFEEETTSIGSKSPSINFHASCPNRIHLKIEVPSLSGYLDNYRASKFKTVSIRSTFALWVGSTCRRHAAPAS